MITIKTKLKINTLKTIIKISLIVLLFFLLGAFVVQSYSLYETRASLNANVDKAIYLITDQKMTFNIDTNAIFPNDESYEYTFSVSNFKNDTEGEFDLEYYIRIKTTTNLPITVKLYRNEEYSSSATNIIPTYSLTQDDDNAWYKIYNNTPTYDLLCDYRITDYYVLVVDFPSSYSAYKEYAGVPENIEVGIYSKQKV